MNINELKSIIKQSRSFIAYSKNGQKSRELFIYSFNDRGFDYGITETKNETWADFQSIIDGGYYYKFETIKYRIKMPQYLYD